MLPEKLYPFNAVRNDILRVENITIELNGYPGLAFTKLYSELYPVPIPGSSAVDELKERILTFLREYCVEMVSVESSKMCVLYGNTDPETDTLSLVYSGFSEEEFMAKSTKLFSSDSTATHLIAWVEGEWVVLTRRTN